MSPSIRVLVVDDSTVVRKLITEVLSEDPQIAVVGTASNGRLALAKLDQLAPDLVTLDIEMPELDGLATLAELRKTRPRLPVIMFSTLTQRAAAATIEALTLGANDYVTKPDDVTSLNGARLQIRASLVPKIKALCKRSGPSDAAPLVVSRPPVAAPRAVRAIAIGVSTGGPPALQKLLGALPRTLGVPVFIVQHMPPVFTTMLAHRLDQLKTLHVVEATEGARVAPDTVYLAPGDFHMTIARDASGADVIRLDREPPQNSCRPAVDVTFRSAVERYGSGVLALVLTGMGQDGLVGCEAVRAAGGSVLAQDQRTSVVWGMPGAVARAGLAEVVGDVDHLAAEIVRRTARRADAAKAV